MFEYINPLFLIMTGLTLLVTILLTLYAIGRVQAEGGKFRVPYFMYIGTTALVIMLFWDAKDTKDTLAYNRELFQTDKVLQCSALGISYIVSKKKGWRLLDKRHFTDGDIILAVKNCKKKL